jgi:small subunit ribosomal protein S20
MPIIKSAKKKLRKDKKKTVINKKVEVKYRRAIKEAKKNKANNLFELIKRAFSEIDKSAKRGVIHKNKANRLKSRISKLLKKNTKK